MATSFFALDSSEDSGRTSGMGWLSNLFGATPEQPEPSHERAVAIITPPPVVPMFQHHEPGTALAIIPGSEVVRTVPLSAEEIAQLIMRRLELSRVIAPHVADKINAVIAELWNEELRHSDTVQRTHIAREANHKKALENNRAQIDASLAMPELSPLLVPHYEQLLQKISQQKYATQSDKSLIAHYETAKVKDAEAKRKAVEVAQLDLHMTEYRYKGDRDVYPGLLEYRRMGGLQSDFVKALTATFSIYIEYLDTHLPTSVEYIGKAITFADFADDSVLDLFDRMMAPIARLSKTKNQIFLILHATLTENMAGVEKKYRGRILPKYTNTLTDTYFSNTPFWRLFDLKLAGPEPLPPSGATVPEIPDEMWFRHTLLLASSGSGKTNTIRWRIEQILPLIAEGKASLILMEPQGDLTRDLLSLAQVYAMRDCLIILDPADISVSVNIFDKPANTSAAGITESIERIGRVLGTISTDLTPQQRVTFTFALRALFAEEAPTMRHLLRILRLNKGDIPPGKLAPPVEDYFRHDFNPSDARFILTRLSAMVADPIFGELFGDVTTFNLHQEMNAGKLIIVRSSAAPILYSKFWIEEIARCIQLRANAPTERKETFLVIDEAALFIGENLHFVDILNRARGMRIGAFVALQSLSDITDERVRGSLITNTSIKISSNTSAHIAPLTRSMGNTDSRFLTTLPEYEFAFFKPGMKEAIKVKFPFVEFTEMPQMTTEQYEAMRAANRKRYMVQEAEPPDEPVPTMRAPVTPPEKKPTLSPLTSDTEGDVEPL